MTSLILLLWAIPAFGFLISLFLPSQKETHLSSIAIITTSVQNILSILFTIFWLTNGAVSIASEGFVLLDSHGYAFFLAAYFDEVTAVFLIVGSVLGTLISLYSKHYLHREKGFKRYFNTILFFFLGYNIIILSGNFETLFFGWEVLGMSSFLLIAFYRERYLPVRNAFKVFSVYRISDIALLLTIWLSHHLWHHSVTFAEFEVLDLTHAYTGMGLTIMLMILVSASVKSAQLPFSSWLPRAMEGPTPSSAIFYGSLSVHIGVFLLLRTFPLWSQYELFRWLVALMGLSTGIVATMIGQVQSSVKSQIAYSSIAQIGLILIEVSLGWSILALIHFTGNAFLRTYQILVSPSTVTYLIREQFYALPSRQLNVGPIHQKLLNSIYLLGLKEGNLDTYQYRLMWAPFKKLGHLFKRIPAVVFLMIILVAFAFVVILPSIQTETTQQVWLSSILSGLGLLLVARAFTERHKPAMSLIMIYFGHLWAILAVSYNEQITILEISLYLSGLIGSMIAGLAVLRFLNKKEANLDLNSFHGHIYEYPMAGLVFLLSSMGLAGFPITPTFIGMDLLFSHIHADQWVLTLFISLLMVISGLASMRLYVRTFLGPHAKTYHPVARRSA